VSLPTRSLGKTGMAVSPIGFGGAVIGIPGYLTPGDRDGESFRKRAATAVRRAAELGVTFFDTAPGYGGGRSETVMGAALEPVRDHVLVATKFHARDGETAADWDASLRASLARLRTDHVDLLQVHGNTWSDEAAGRVLGDVAPWLDQVRAKGLARFAGITAETPTGGLERLIRSGSFDVLQVAYNAIYQGACDYQREPFGVIPLARARGMGVLTMRTTTSGVLPKLLRSEFPELSPQRITRLAIKFVLSTPEVDCALVGMTDPAEVEASCALAADTGDRLDLAWLHNRFLPGDPSRPDPMTPSHDHQPEI
jgi:hypothetical protein